MAQEFGLSKILPYNNIRHASDVPEIIGKYCYILEPYIDSGFSILAENSSLRLGNFDGSLINPLNDHKYEEHIRNVLHNNANNILNLLKIAAVDMCQIYFCESGKDMVIADVRTHYDKFLGPGMIRDIISKAIGISMPKVMSIEVVDDKFIANNSNIVVKPSGPMMITRNDDVEPLRARI